MHGTMADMQLTERDKNRSFSRRPAFALGSPADAHLKAAGPGLYVLAEVHGTLLIDVKLQTSMKMSERS
jgi:hypothetical protein